MSSIQPCGELVVPPVPHERENPIPNLSDLPIDCILKILRNLEPPDLMELASTCRHFQELIESEPARWQPYICNYTDSC